MSLFSTKDLPPPSIPDQIAELERELGLRQRVYPRWVREGKLREGVAEERMRRLEAARDSLVRLAKIDAGTGT